MALVFQSRNGVAVEQYQKKIKREDFISTRVGEETPAPPKKKVKYKTFD